MIIIVIMHNRNDLYYKFKITFVKLTCRLHIICHTRFLISLHKIDSTEMFTSPEWIEFNSMYTLSYFRKRTIANYKNN